MTFIVVRHGESLWNKENKFTGWVDIDLSEKGITEAINVGLLLKDQHFDFIITSDLSRAKKTAQLIYANQSFDDENISIFLESKDIKERNYGELAGVDKKELAKKYGDKQMHLWRRSYFARPPKGENLEDVRIRIGGYYDDTILPLLKQNKNILMVAHGNSIRALFVHLGIKTEQNIENFEIANATPICIDIDNTNYCFINDYELLGAQIIDSRGFPTIQVSCFDKNSRKIIGKGSSPSGASCGSNEVLELRDKNKDLYKGKSVFKSVETIYILNKKMNLTKSSILDLKKMDEQLINLDGTKMKTFLGGNTTTAVSFCIADTAAKLLGMELFEYIAKTYQLINKGSSFTIPTPFVNIINGGKHGVTDDLKIQEFMIFPNETYSVAKKMQIICEVYQTLQEILVRRYGKQAKSIGDEGGFCPPIYSTEVALTTIEEAIIEAKYIVGVDVFLALDCAASEFYNEETKLYEIEKNKFVTYLELVEYYGNLVEKHPALKSIEDGFHETDYEAWKLFTSRFSDKIMIVGDDLFTTNKTLIKQGLQEKWANSLLLKVNQIGTISEAIESASFFVNTDVQTNNENVIVSHRSGETNHSYIIDIAVGIGAKYVKIGSPCRGERTAKFNRLIEIEQILEI